METVLRIGLSNAVIGAALAILAAGAGRILRRPAAAHLLWVLVLIKLLTPPLWTVPVRFSSAPVPASHQVPVEISAAQDDFVAPAVRHEELSAESVNPINHITRSAVGLWALGSLTCLLVTALRLRQFREVLSVATAAPDDLQRQTRNLASRLGMRRCPSVWLVPGRICPMVFAGLHRPRLLLPMDLCQRLTPDQQSTLLLHELAHLRRGDHLIRLLELAATIAYWWNPIVWWARHELREAEEQCCDAWVTWTMPAEAHQYASALVDAVDFACQSIPRFGPRLPLLASGIGEFGHLQRRLVMILQCNGNRKIGWSGTVCACVLAALLPLSFTRADDAKAPAKTQAPAESTKSDAAPTTQPGKENKVDPKLQAMLNRELPKLDFDAVGLSDVIDFLHDVTGTKIVVDWKALEQAGVGRNAPVTAKLHDIKFAKLLNVLLDSLSPQKGKIIYEPTGNQITITATGEDKLELRVYNMRELLKQPDGKAKLRALVKKITETVDPKSWGQKDGRSALLDDAGGAILVTQSPENQKAVAKVIEAARDGGKAGESQ